MRVLALETASEACSVALLAGDELIARRTVQPRRHAELVLGMVDELLAEAGFALGALDGLAFGRGPGAFTGLRIASGVTQGLALGADLPVAPISTLLALGEDALGDDRVERVVAALDARMGEIYVGACRRGADGLATPVMDERCCPPEALLLPGDGPWLGVGSGFAAHGPALAARLGKSLARTLPGCLPDAAAVARLAVPVLRDGLGVAAEQALPVYLRDTVATPPRPR